MACSGFPDPPKVLIFDWDDTICPSSFVDRYQVEKFSELPENVRRIFRCCCCCCCGLPAVLHSTTASSGTRWAGFAQPLFKCVWSILFPSLVLVRINHPLNRCGTELTIRPLHSFLVSQVQKLFNEIARIAEKCLHEASIYGEVGPEIVVVFAVALLACGGDSGDSSNSHPWCLLGGKASSIQRLHVGRYETVISIILFYVSLAASVRPATSTRQKLRYIFENRVRTSVKCGKTDGPRTPGVSPNFLFGGLGKLWRRSVSIIMMWRGSSERHVDLPHRDVTSCLLLLFTLSGHHHHKFGRWLGQILVRALRPVPPAGDEEVPGGVGPHPVRTLLSQPAALLEGGGLCSRSQRSLRILQQC